MPADSESLNLINSKDGHDGGLAKIQCRFYLEEGSEEKWEKRGNFSY
jgi:hypothetical protein